MLAPRRKLLFSVLYICGSVLQLLSVGSVRALLGQDHTKTTEMFSQNRLFLCLCGARVIRLGNTVSFLVALMKNEIPILAKNNNNKQKRQTVGMRFCFFAMLLIHKYINI